MDRSRATGPRGRVCPGAKGGPGGADRGWSGPEVEWAGVEGAGGGAGRRWSGPEGEPAAGGATALRRAVGARARGGGGRGRRYSLAPGGGAPGGGAPGGGAPGGGAPGGGCALARRRPR